MKNTSMRLAGIFLALGTVILIVRMAPVMSVLDGGMEALPQTGEDIMMFLSMYESNWIAAHLFALIAFPLHMIAFITIYRNLDDRHPATLNIAFVVAGITGAALYLMAVIVDGFGVPVAAQQLAGDDSAVAIVGMMHNFALTFFAPGIVGYFLAIGLMGVMLIQTRYTGLIFSGIAMLVGAIGIGGYVSGQFGLYFNNITVAMPATMLMFLTTIVLGVRLAWHPAPLERSASSPSLVSPELADAR